MAIAITLKQYLADNGIEYDALSHPHTYTSSKTAQASHIPGSRIAKAVLLKKDEDYVLAVLPASRHIRFDDVVDAAAAVVAVAAVPENSRSRTGWSRGTASASP